MILKSRQSRSGPNSYKKTRRLIYLGNPRGKHSKTRKWLIVLNAGKR